MKKIFPIVVLILILASCETIYNYDFSYISNQKGQSTQNLLQQLIPKSLNAQKGTIENEMLLIFQKFDENQVAFIDSIRKDIKPLNDTTILLKIQLTALDPYDVEITKTYSKEITLIAW